MSYKQKSKLVTYHLFPSESTQNKICESVLESEWPSNVRGFKYLFGQECLWKKKKKHNSRWEQRKGSQSQKTQSKLLTSMGSASLRELSDSTAMLIYWGAASKEKRGIPSLSCHHILDPNRNSTDGKTYPMLYKAHLVSPLHMNRHICMVLYRNCAWQRAASLYTNDQRNATKVRWK